MADDGIFVHLLQQDLSEWWILWFEGTFRRSIMVGSGWFSCAHSCGLNPIVIPGSSHLNILKSHYNPTKKSHDHNPIMP